VLKRLRERTGHHGWELRSDNPAFPPIAFDPAPGGDRLIATLIEVLSESPQRQS